ncbi:hypothetical protein [Streptomyces sp. NPDC047097]|uniref:hypothetical protein n=1 Tax=Streptomyces sp. NPDC047097 TaxID=3155260 RepID=UPI0033CDB577
MSTHRQAKVPGRAGTIFGAASLALTMGWVGYVGFRGPLHETTDAPGFLVENPGQGSTDVADRPEDHTPIQGGGTGSKPSEPRDTTVRIYRHDRPSAGQREAIPGKAPTTTRPGGGDHQPSQDIVEVKPGVGTAPKAPQKDTTFMDGLDDLGNVLRPFPDGDGDAGLWSPSEGGQPPGGDAPGTEPSGPDTPGAEVPTVPTEPEPVEPTGPAPDEVVPLVEPRTTV